MSPHNELELEPCVYIKITLFSNARKPAPAVSKLFAIKGFLFPTDKIRVCVNVLTGLIQTDYVIFNLSFSLIMVKGSKISSIVQTKKLNFASLSKQKRLGLPRSLIFELSLVRRVRKMPYNCCCRLYDQFFWC